MACISLLPQRLQNLSTVDLWKLPPSDRHNLAFWLKNHDWENLQRLAQQLEACNS